MCVLLPLENAFIFPRDVKIVSEITLGRAFQRYLITRIDTDSIGITLATAGSTTTDFHVRLFERDLRFVIRCPGGNWPYTYTYMVTHSKLERNRL
ncbi:uncharacterized protein C8R40DRAFT_490625 [Lentinula edodes]|uniref:uncharacterized protein n=1 Tax=Lentinula edodes TaxID=5353 RepID=UPI001E8D4CEC|nr:uncharacterized protein C8R40DRAFT_490625 [Lentinula edodes]KAH7872545.1 hypothetical protein C8R40DRAFT_490625 [Lentinula edodes]